MSEKKIAVSLSALDWQSVVGLLMSQVERDRQLDPVWTVGANRVRYIVNEIVACLPKEESK